MLKKRIQRKLVTWSLLFTGLFLLPMLSGCSTQNNDIKNEKLNVVSTTTMLTDLVQEIGGEKVDVIPLMGPGIDPHEYVATQGDVTSLTNADVVIYSGLHLEAAMGDVLGKLDDNYVICAGGEMHDGKLVGGALNSKDLNYYDGEVDPHFWFNISLWKKVTTYVANELGKADPDNVKYYQENAKRYVMELDILEYYSTKELATIPENQRVLITAHDAYGYFAKAYDLEVYAPQGISTTAQASSSAIAQVADFVVENKIKTMFVETSVSNKNVESIQESSQNKGWDVKIAETYLYSDSIGSSADGHDSYITAVKSNVDAIVSSLK